MAKRRRTRKQKKAAGTRQKLKHSGGQALRKLRLAKSMRIEAGKHSGGQSRKKVSDKKIQAGGEELGNKKLIIKDLKKTIIVGLIVSGALAGIYFFLR